MRPQPRILPARPKRRTLYLLPPPPPCEDVTAACAQAFTQAEDGYLRAVAIAGLTRDGVTTIYAAGDQDWRLLPFAVDCLRNRMRE